MQPPPHLTYHLIHASNENGRIGLGVDAETLLQYAKDIGGFLGPILVEHGLFQPNTILAQKGKFGRSDSTLTTGVALARLFTPQTETYTTYDALKDEPVIHHGAPSQATGVILQGDGGLAAYRFSPATQSVENGVATLTARREDMYIGEYTRDSGFEPGHVVVALTGLALVHFDVQSDGVYAPRLR